MKIRPLRCWREAGGNVQALPIWVGTPIHGNQSYLSCDMDFCIRYNQGRWYVQELLAKTRSEAVWNAMTASGVLSAQFERRRDAVEALEAVLEGMG